MYILVAAFKDEVLELLETEQNHLVISGIGKINSIFSISERFQKENGLIKGVINLGTAGSDRIPANTLVQVTKCFQRDTAFYSDPILLIRRTELLEVGCGSGDGVEKSKPNDPWDIVDMELYSLAFFCREKCIPLVSIKYVTDRNDGNVYKEWKRQLPNASRSLSQFWIEQKESILSGLCPK